jgi:hypothetical protein
VARKTSAAPDFRTRQNNSVMTDAFHFRAN